VLLIMIGIGIGLGCSREAKEIRIGGIFPMTGGSATFGKSSKEGMQIAVDEFNEKGGIVIIPELFRQFQGWRMVLYSLILIIVMRFRPNGIIGEREFGFIKRR